MTRLIWVIIFAVIVGLLLLFTLRSLQRGTSAALGVQELDNARRELEHRFPRAEFTIRLSVTGPDARAVLVNVRPGPYADRLDSLLDRSRSILEDELAGSGFDSVKLFVADSLCCALPLGPAR